MHRFPSNNLKTKSAGDILRFWRKFYGISQLDLSLEIGTSSRHLSFVETGKSRPSRNLILKLCEALKLPFRLRNCFLTAAGYAAEFGEEPSNGKKMEIIRQALQRIIQNHEPYPAVVLNSTYKILMKTSGFDRIVTFFTGSKLLEKYDNLYLMTFAADGLGRYIEHWPLVRHYMLGRLWQETLSTQNEELISLALC